MTEAQITEKFNEVVADNALMKQIEATKYQKYTWRHSERQKTGIATMLEVLFRLELLEFKK